MHSGMLGIGICDGGDPMNQLPVYDDFEPRSEADAQAEWDEWMKQAIMDDKAQ